MAEIGDDSLSVYNSNIINSTLDRIMHSLNVRLLVLMQNSTDLTAKDLGYNCFGEKKFKELLKTYDHLSQTYSSKVFATRS